MRRVLPGRRGFPAFALALVAYGALLVAPSPAGAYTTSPAFKATDFATGFPSTCCTTGGAFGPIGLAWDATRHLYVADAANGLIYRFDASGGTAAGHALNAGSSPRAGCAISCSRGRRRPGSPTRSARSSRPRRTPPRAARRRLRRTSWARSATKWPRSAARRSAPPRQTSSPCSRCRSDLERNVIGARCFWVSRWLGRTRLVALLWGGVNDRLRPRRACDQEAAVAGLRDHAAHLVAGEGSDRRRSHVVLWREDE